MSMLCHHLSLSNTAYIHISPKAPPMRASFGPHRPISSPPSFPSQLPQFSVSSLHIHSSLPGLPTHSLNQTVDGDELQETILQMVGRRGLLTTLVSSIMVTSGQGITCQSVHAREGAGNGKEDLETIHLELRKVLKRPKAAGMLRLVFHDAGTFNLAKLTGGMNGSIIYELDRPENARLDRPIKILDMVKASLDQYLQVSWADLIAVAGAEAVAICGGPQIPVKLGRLDTVSADPEGELPAESLNASSLKRNFLRKGFKTRELVVLSGAHTLGNKGFGNPLVFDNSYFKVLLQQPWKNGDEMTSMIGLPSDWTLVDDDQCFRWISYYANNESKFFDDFSAAYLKLVNSGAKWGTRQSM